MFRTWDKFFVCASASASLTFVTMVVGEIDYALIFLIICMITDFITGLACGFIKKELSSNKAFMGLIRKLFILVYVMLAHHLDVLLGVDYIRSAVCFLYAANECLSIIENGTKLKLPIPIPIKKALEILNGGEADDDE